MELLGSFKGVWGSFGWSSGRDFEEWRVYAMILVTSLLKWP